jgi:uncharacterized membrane protein
MGALGLVLLLAGLALWSGAHLFKRVAPVRRAGMGDAGKGVMAVLILVSLVAMIYGYRWAPFVPIWTPPAFLVHINNLLNLLAVFVFFLGAIPGRLRTRIRHPQLIGFKTWAVAHLLVNGDLASILLFGILLAWAVVEVIRINRAEPDWTPPAPGPARNDAIWAAGSLVVFAAIVWLHGWLGPWPLPM